MSNIVTNLDKYNRLVERTKNALLEWQSAVNDLNSFEFEINRSSMPHHFEQSDSVSVQIEDSN
jgi:hypothetical protein